jgi:hypothetical protein
MISYFNEKFRGCTTVTRCVRINGCFLLTEELFSHSLKTLQNRFRELQFEEFSKSEENQTPIYDIYIYNSNPKPLAFRFVNRKTADDYLSVLQNEIDTCLDSTQIIRFVVVLDKNLNEQKIPQKQTAEILITFHHSFEDGTSFTNLINELLVLLFERENSSFRKEIETVQSEYIPDMDDILTYREQYTNEEKSIKEGVQPLLNEIKPLFMNPFDKSKSREEWIEIYHKLKSTDQQLFELEQQQQKPTQDKSKDLSLIRKEIVSCLPKIIDKIADHISYDIPLCKLYERQTHCRVLRIEEPLFLLIKKACSQHNITLHPLITAVGLFALAKREYQIQKKNNQTDKDELFFGTATPCNIRKEINPPIPKSSLGLMIASQNSLCSVRKNQTKLWSLAKQLHTDQSYSSEKNWKYFSLFGNEEIRPLPDNIDDLPQISPVIPFSNMGVADIQPTYTSYPDDPQNPLHSKVEVDMLFCSGQIRGFGDCIFHITSVKKTMYIVIWYIHPMISDESGQYILDTMHDIYTSIANDPSLNPVIQDAKMDDGKYTL